MCLISGARLHLINSLGSDKTKEQLRIPSTYKMTLQFERKYSTQGSGAPCHVSFGFFSGFCGIILPELQMDPQPESTTQPKARELLHIECDFAIALLYQRRLQDNTGIFEDLQKQHSRTLGTTREDVRITQISAGVPSSLGMLQILLRTFGLWYSGTLEDYSSRSSRLLEVILLDYKVLGGLSYGPPWAHYLSGYQDRLLGGPLGLPDLCRTVPDGVRRKEYGGEVLG
jgi:hypothetical protein